MDKKRALEGGDSPAGKRARSDVPPTNAANVAPSDDAAKAALITQKRAEIAAKIAAMNAKKAAPAPAVPAGLPSAAALAQRVADAKKRVADAQMRVQAPAPAQRKKAPEPAPAPAQGAGLKMAAHPLLLDATPSGPQSKKDRYKPMQPKFATIQANIRNAPAPSPATGAPAVRAAPIAASANPYLAASAEADAAAAEGAPRERVGRTFRFNTKGKYTAQAEQLRKDAALEALKQRIAATARKAGLEPEFEAVEKSIKREAPPDAEWWDAPLLPSGTYDDLDRGTLNVAGAGSPITIYVQHPIPLQPPGEGDKAVLKPLKLTTREQKKLTKGRRQAVLQDHRDRIKMGLIPPDAPKVRLANLMKVLTSDAIQDPTKVEARVRREVAVRKHNHEKMNVERKLTDEQRRTKLETKKADEEKKGVYGAVFRVKNLSDPAQRYKVRKNAEQLSLTGVCLLNPAFTLVYVEGAARFVRKYKHLLLQRIAWTEAARARDDVEVDTSAAPAPAKEEEPAQSLEDNRCDLVWEGQLRERAFGTFKPKACPTDHLAKETLGPKLHGYWDMAKNYKPEEDEPF